MKNNANCLKTNYFFLGIVILGFSYCSNSNHYPGEVLSTLNLADSNAKELRKVLDYYKSDRSNPLKFKAACFLISNMQNCGSEKHPNDIPPIVKTSFLFIDSLIKATYFSKENDSLFQLTDYLNSQLDTDDFLPTEDIIDSLVSWKFGAGENIQKFKKETLHFWRISDSVRDELLENIRLVPPVEEKFMDARQIKADWLIRHIENAFKMWKESPFAKNMHFDEFSETLLSYRSLNEAIDTDLPSDSCYKIFHNIVKVSNNDIATTIKNLNFYIYAADCFEDNGRNLGCLGFYDILQFYKYDCDRHSEWTVRVLNACGVPAYLDFTSGFFIRDKMHFGVSVRDSTGKYHHFSPKWQQIDDTAHSKLFSKVFRNTFSSQKFCPANLKQENEDIPPVFADSHIKDVTEEFHIVTNISVSCDSIPKSVNLGYIAIFTPKGWKPIGWGLVNRKDKLVVFDKVPKDAMYIAGFYADGRFTPFSQPFFLNTHGNISFIKPNYQSTQDLHLFRKYPLKPHLVTHMLDMVGSRIEAANKKDFSGAVVLHTLEYADLRDFGIKAITINSKKKYKYVRIVPPEGKMLNIAGIDFFSKSKPYQNTQRAILPDTLFPQDTLAQNTAGLKKIPFCFLPNSQNLTKVADGNMETFISVPQLGMDLMSPQEIEQIRIAPRNANNGIVACNTYKLYYYDKEWKEKEQQTATYNYLDFEELPADTIYWLQNVNGGKEELPFIYSNNKQVFLNNNELIESFGNSALLNTSNVKN